MFQAAGPTADSIRSSVAEYRIALGGQDNRNNPGSDGGHREINWDGGSTTNLNTAVAGNPFDGFQATRGALFTTPDGNGFVQAPAAGLAVLFNHPTYGAIFAPFSPARLFSAVGSKITDVDFFVPCPDKKPATVSGFGAVFTDIDRPDGSGPGEKQGNCKASTLIEYFGVGGELLFSSFVPASPGRGGQSFFGIVFPDARIARVRITSGNVAPGPDDGGKLDVVMMDDFLYGEPKSLPNEWPGAPDVGSRYLTAFEGLFSNKWLWGAVLLSLVMQAAVIYLPFLQQAFSTVGLGAGDWLRCAAVASSVLWLRELSKLVTRAAGRE